MKPRLALLALAAWLLAPSAWAWNSFGHMVVAELAFRQLTPTARAEVSRLLKKNPDYQKWIAGVPENQREEAAFLRASTWPDAIKSNSSYLDDKAHDSGEKAGRNIGYGDRLQHRYWHFVDLPFSSDDSELDSPESPNALTQIEAFRIALADPSKNDTVRSYDLSWLIHLVGDVHQPLHASSRFTTMRPHGDRGGNSVAVCLSSCDQTLHGYWDGLLGSGTSLQGVRSVASSIPNSGSVSSAGDVSEWIDESFGLARNQVYVGPIGENDGPFTLDKNYKTQAKKLARLRAAQAGSRLARLINEACQ